MKRTLGTVLALCLLLSCALVLSACGGNDGGMTESEWNAALNLSNKQAIACTIPDGKYTIEIRYDGENYSHSVKSPESEQPVSEVRWIKDGDKYIVYELEDNGDWSEAERSEREFSEALSATRSMYLRNYAEAFKLGDFTLNAGTGKYEAAEIVSVQESMVGTIEERYYNVSISFENKQVCTIEFTDDKQLENSMSFSFDGIEITAPVDERPVGPIADEAAWNTALDLTALDGVTIVQKQGNTLVSSFKWDGTNLYVEMAGVYILVEKDGNSYYTYTKSILTSNTWSGRTEVDEATYNAYLTAYLRNSEIYPFAEFRYNPTTEQYEASAIDQTGDGVTVTVTDVKVSFAEGRPDKISYAYGGATTVMTYTYDAVTIEIPGSNS